MCCEDLFMSEFEEESSESVWQRIFSMFFNLLAIVVLLLSFPFVCVLSLVLFAFTDSGFESFGRVPVRNKCKLG